MNKYELTESGVKDLETGASIPNASGNRHWREYQDWLAEDVANIPRPICPPYCSWVDGAWVEDTVAKQAAIDAAEIRLLELGAGELFFRLCKVLIDGGLIDPQAANMAEIKAAYLDYKVLKGL